MSEKPPTPIISLREFIDQLEILNDQCQPYLNIRTGEFTILTEEWKLTVRRLEEEEDPLSQFDIEWQKEAYQEAREILYSEDYLSLPTQYDIHEYQIMKDFCYEVAPEHLRHRLLDAISGRGAFRRFKEAVYHFGIRDQWFRYRKQAFKDIAIGWLELNGFEYIDDVEI